MAEKVVCNKCGVEYTDKESIEQTKEWTANGYAPCPNLGCSGKLEVKQASTTVKEEGQEEAKYEMALSLANLAEKVKVVLIRRAQLLVAAGVIGKGWKSPV